MKKWMSVLLSVMMIFASAGCQKKETAVEIAQKVAEKQNECVNLTMTMEMQVNVSTSGVSLEMPMTTTILIDYPNDLEKMAMESEMSIEVLGSAVDAKTYLSDGIVYTESNGSKTKTELNAEEMQSYVQQAEGSNMVQAELLETFEVEQSDAGYLLSGEFTEEYFTDAFETMMNPESMKEVFGDDAEFDEVFGQMNVETFTASYEVSKDYQLTAMDCHMKMSMEIEGEVTEISVDLHATYDTSDEEKVVLPDFTDWDKKRIACVVETDAESSLIMVEADGEETTYVGFINEYSYEAMGFTEDEHKALLKARFEEIYGGYEDQGLVLYMNENGDILTVEFAVDYQNVTDEVLSLLGLSAGLTYSELVGDTSGMECLNY